MGLKNFSIEYDGEFQCPGHMISGRIHLSIDAAMKVKEIQLRLIGKAKVNWKEKSGDGDSISRKGKEEYFRKTLTLLGDGRQKFELPAGDYVYPFSAIIPASSPPTFESKYGGIEYRGKVKLYLASWLSADRMVEKHFIVKKPIDLNEFTEPYRVETKETFLSCFRNSAPLTATVCIPRLGFVRGEAISITINVDNASNVEVNWIKIELKQYIKWIAGRSSKEKKIKMDFRNLDGVSARASKTWTVEFGLCSSTYPNSGDCGIIQIKYELAIKMYPSGLHSMAKIKTPITIGDFSSGALLPDSSVTGTEVPHLEGNTEPNSEATGTSHPERTIDTTSRACGVASMDSEYVP